MACEEAELGSDKFAGKTEMQKKLQEQVSPSIVIKKELIQKFIVLSNLVAATRDAKAYA